MNSMIFDPTGAPPLFDIRALWETLWRRKLLIMAVAAAVVALAVGYLATTRPSYTATAAILVDPRDVRSTNIDSVLPGIGADSAAIASQVSVIQSRELLGAVFADLGLANDPDYAGGGGMLSSLLGMFRAPVAANAETVFQKFRGTIGVEREGLTYVINVSVKSGDPEKAARIANAVVERYIAGNAQQQSTATSDVNSALNTRIVALQDDLTRAERDVEAFKQANGIFDQTTGGTLQSQIDQLSVQVLAAQESLDQLQTRYDQARAAGTSPEGLARLGEVTVSPTADLLRADYNQRAAELASAQATFGPRHPNVVRAQAQLAKVTDLLSREAGRIVRELQSERDAARSNLDKLQASLDALRARAGETGVAQVELRQLQGRADAARAVLDDFLKRSQETSQMQGLQSSQVHVISRAAPPPDPTWPKPMLVLPVSAGLGLMLGAAMALVLGNGPVRSVSAPSPSPAPVDPNPPRRAVPPRPERPVPAAALPKVTPARRFAGLDGARREIFGPTETALTRALQDALRDALAALPPHRPTYLIAFSSLTDPDLARDGAAIMAMGFERIGGRVLLLKSGDTVPPLIDYNFVLVDAVDELGGEADLDILVLAPDDQAPRHAAGQRVTFRLPATFPRDGKPATSQPETRPVLVAS